jgi:cyanophycin synthetase
MRIVGLRALEGPNVSRHAPVIGAWPHRRRACVVSAPGDRADELIRESARTLTRHFERVIVEEDDDRRGRPPGEVARLMVDAIEAESPTTRCSVVLDERAAVETALRDLGRDALLVVFCEELMPMTDLLVARGGRPTTIERRNA